jgi:hypothetical protein
MKSIGVRGAFRHLLKDHHALFLTVTQFLYLVSCIVGRFKKKRHKYGALYFHQ